MDIEVVADLECGCGERPTWLADSGLLYFTDVDNPALYCFDSTSGETRQVYHGEDVIGGLTLHEDGRLLLFKARGAICLWSESGGEETLLEGIEGEEESRFNDVFADPAGRVFCGTMPAQERPGRLYRWDPDGTLNVLLEEAGMPNGMGLSPDLRWFYRTDTEARTIYRHSYDLGSGTLGPAEVLVPPSDADGNPDGLAIDDEGCLWSAQYGGHRLARYAPDGREMSHLPLPMAENPTCPAFAGAGSSTLYLTTAGGGYRPAAGTAAGALLRVNMPVRGGPVYCSRGG